MQTARRHAVVGLAVTASLALLLGQALEAAAMATADATHLSASAPAVGASSRSEGRAKLWVFFTDKALDGGGERAAIAEFRSRLPLKALRRRAKVGKDVDYGDLPVAKAYVSSVERTGAALVTRSRWLNAISVFASPAERAAIESLPFVKEVRPVARGTKRLPDAEPVPQAQPGTRVGRALNYGPALCQVQQIEIDLLHEEGFDGSGVTICVLDTGFDTDHQAFRHLDIIGERDFINDDTNTANEPGDPAGQDDHGTKTLSCIGAAYDGELYGGSYAASFAIGKTEILDQEIQVEEDYWVEGLEWGDSLGSDIVSSSLGYTLWYTYADMDGNTAVTTIAADMAAARGIVVVNSMGNEATGDWRYMIAPADGDSVLSIGAVTCAGDRTSWSSVGPTYDGRIKPDVMAMGSAVYVVTSADTSTYTYASGTSFSCPMTAGAVGLLLQGHPEWTPTDVIDALHSTATQSGAPDTLMGWGIVQAHDAMHSEPLSVEGEASVRPRYVRAYPNPSSPEARIEYVVPEAGRVLLEVYDVSGRLVRVLEDGESARGVFVASWDGRDASGTDVASGVYFLRLKTDALTASAKTVLVR